MVERSGLPGPAEGHRDPARGPHPGGGRSLGHHDHESVLSCRAPDGGGTGKIEDGQRHPVRSEGRGSVCSSYQAEGDPVMTDVSKTPPPPQQPYTAKGPQNDGGYRPSRENSDDL